MQERAMLQQAASQLHAGNPAAAAATCQQVLHNNPASADALQLLAMAARDGGNAGQAEALFQKSLALAPRRPDFLANYGAFLRSQQRLAEARKYLRRATRSDPKFMPAWHQLGLLLHAEGEFNEALKCARKVTQLAPDHAPGWELLASAQQKLGDVRGAIDTGRKGLKRCPGAPRLLYSLAQLLRQETRFGEAAQAYREALAAGFSTPDLFRNLAESHFEIGDIEHAMETATQGVQRFPQDAQLHRSYARLHWELQVGGDPLEALRTAARNNPQRPELWQTLVELLNRFKRHDEAATALQDAQGLGCPATIELRMLEAMAIARSGDAGRAADLFDALLLAQPDHQGLQLNYAHHLLAHGDPGRAETLCSKALEQDPLNQLALAYLGTAWQMLGDPREHLLMDYERMVNPVQLTPPAGFADARSFMAAVQEVLEGLHRSQAHPIDQTVRGGTQTNGHLFRLQQPLLKQLEAQIREAASRVIETFPREANHPLWGRRRRGQTGVEFAGAWSVRLRSEGYHTDHIHPEGWLSSALYIALPDEVRQQPEHSHAGHIRFGVPLLEPPSTLEPRRVVKPEVGTLVLFPSYMWHGTVPFTSEQPRITVAFDLVPAG